MNDLRKAAEQALEALNLASRNGSDGLKRYEIRELDDTIAELHAALAQPEQEPAAVVAMDASGVHMSYGGQYLGQKPDTKIAMLLKDLPVGTPLYVAVGMGISNE